MVFIRATGITLPGAIRGEPSEGFAEAGAAWGAPGDAGPASCAIMAKLNREMITPSRKMFFMQPLFLKLALARSDWQNL
jgi:hypothetical protein